MNRRQRTTDAPDPPSHNVKSRSWSVYSVAVHFPAGAVAVMNGTDLLVRCEGDGTASGEDAAAGAAAALRCAADELERLVADRRVTTAEASGSE